jgi:DNA-binding PadR family transcriptional regulator
MDKKLVLETFASRSFPLTPDDLRSICLEQYARTSVYVYLLRLKQQKLVERTFVGGRIAYRLTGRGIERLEYFRRKHR